ncbi:hypothetical protein [Kineococcus sp. SYSU DK006]|uniref:hypothetical protein n=1 Tax=Kineococcus sp. SYSU DK006 TaxID=3383127 RepID=UPI003D7E76E0
MHVPTGAAAGGAAHDAGLGTPGEGTGAPRPRRAVVALASAATVLALAAAVVAPVVIGGQHADAATSLRTGLQQVATAQAAWKAENGRYTTRLDDLGLAQVPQDVAIVHADATSFCAGAYDASTRSVLFYSSVSGFSTTACS